MTKEGMQLPMAGLRTLARSAKARALTCALLASACASIVAAPANAADPVIAAAGDIACDTSSEFYNGGAGVEDHCRQRATSDLLVGGGFASVLALGDLQYHVGALDDFNAVFDRTWGRVKPIIRPVPGNHEYSTSNARGYFDYFNGVGRDDGPAGARAKGYYSFDVGAWHVIALNSACDQVAPGGAADGCAPGSPQERWLQSDLAAHRTSCTLAYWHSPRFNSGLRGNSGASQTFWDVLHRAGADIVLGGDAHDYERFAPQDPAGNPDPVRGIRAFVVGTGGVFFTGWSKVKANSEVRHNDTFGVLALTLRPTSYEWRFLPEAGKTFTDSGTGACHGRTAGFVPSKAPVLKRPAARSRCTIRGTAEDDRLDGTAGRDVICGLGGDDLIRGLGGNDAITGGAGDDRVSGGKGDDRLSGGSGDDLVRGQSGRDRVLGGLGRDRLHGDSGNDRLFARGGGRDRVFGGRGRDRAKVGRTDRVRSVERVSRR